MCVCVCVLGRGGGYSPVPKRVSPALLCKSTLLCIRETMQLSVAAINCCSNYHKIPESQKSLGC